MHIHKNKLSLFIYIFFGSFFVKGAFSAPLPFPEGCVPLSSIEQALDIHTKTPQIILIYNDSTYALWLNATFAKSITSSHLSSHHWSAFKMNPGNLTVKCIEVKPGAEQYIPCHKAIHACSYNQIHFTDKNNYSHWITEDEAALPSLSSMVK